MSNAIMVPTGHGPKTGEADRLLYVDNVRWLLAVLVVLVHVAVTYANIGDFWYYAEDREVDVPTIFLLASLCSMVQAFSMGLFFFIAGSLVPGAYERKGAGAFVAGRLFRLGVPTAVFMFVLHPLTEIIKGSLLSGLPADLPRAYAGYITSLEFLSESGPLWFAFALLAFSLVYGLVRFAADRLGGTNGAARGAAGLGRVTHGKVIGLAAVIAALSFLVRIWFPFGTDILNLKPAYFPQYILLFAAGIRAARGRGFQDLPDGLGRTWLRIALFAGIPAYFVVMVAGGVMEGDLGIFFGGLHWQAAAYALWDTLFCLGMVLGLLTLYRRKYDRQGRLARFAARNAFGVYVFHTPLVVLITLLLKDWTAHPLLKTVAALLLSLSASFLASEAIRRVRPFRRVFA